MKFYLPLSAASLAALLLASCSQDDIHPVSTDGLTNIEITLPDGIATRYGEGKQATNLFVAVYPHGANDVLLTNVNGDQDGLSVNNFTGGNLTTTVSVQLAKGSQYDLIFWAESGDGKSGPYTFSPENKTVTVSYDNMANFAESRDAFFAHLDGLTASGQTVKVTLNRPFAQINIGTDDFAAYLRAAGPNLSSQKFGMTVSGVSNVLNLADGSVSSTSDFNGSVSVAQQDIAIGNSLDAFPPVSFLGSLQYLDMGYFLVGDLGVVKNNLDVTLSVGDNSSFAKFPNIPAQMNYRTNIYGSLLTNTENFNVEINPIFGGSYEVAAWDGKTVTKPAVDETAKTVSVAQPSEYAGLVEMVNGSGSQQANNFAGYTINILTDLDFGGHEIPMIADGATRFGPATLGKSFQGVLDGHGNTLRNFTINNSDASANQLTGVITNLKGVDAKVQNINFENISLSTTKGEQLGVVGVVSGGATVSNVHVLSGTIRGHEAVGGIAGRVIIDGTIEKCSNAATISADSYNVGGIAGTAYYTSAGKEMHITDCTNTGAITSGGVSTGGIVGFSTAFISGCNNSAPVTGLQNSVGGIAGTQRTAGGISDCHNTGDITGNPNGNNAALGVGGIAGWVTYQGGTGYGSTNVITIENCSNSGKVVANPAPSGPGNSYAAGGIVGLWYNMGTVKGCSNTSTLISAQQMVAGIVGSSQWLAVSGIPDGAEEMLYITGNSTTTTLDQMTGALKAILCYVNDATKVTFSGNTPAANQ